MKRKRCEIREEKKREREKGDREWKGQKVTTIRFWIGLQILN